MDSDTALGVAAELRHFLKEGWVATYDAVRFTIAPPIGSKPNKSFADELPGEVWRIARLVAYRNFVSIQREPDGGYTIISVMESGNGFEIRFLSAAP